MRSRLGPAVLGLPVWLSLIAGALLSGLLAFIVGRPILRLRGYYLAVATLGFGLLIWMFFNNESELTGGPNGMQVPRLVLFGWRAVGPLSLVLDFRRQPWCLAAGSRSI